MADAVRFKIGDKVYTTAALDEVSLRDLLTWQAQVQALGLSFTWDQIMAQADELAAAAAGAPEPDLTNVDHLLMLAVTIWASRRAAGEDVTFADAIDFPLSQLTYIDAPQDHAPKAKSKARKSARKVSTVDVDLVVPDSE